MKRLSELLSEAQTNEIDPDALHRYFMGINYWLTNRNADKNDLLDYGQRGCDPDGEQVINMQALLSPGASIVVQGKRLAGGELTKIQTFLKKLFPAYKNWSEVQEEYEDIDDLVDEINQRADSADDDDDDEPQGKVVNMPPNSLNAPIKKLPPSGGKPTA